MALTKAPLFGLDASGTIAGAIVFSKWKGRNYVRRHAVPSNPKSGLQVGMRSMFKFVAQDYVNLSAAFVAEWKAIADLTATTPLNAQMQTAQRNARQNFGAVKAPSEVAGTTPTAPATLVIGVQPKSLAVSWTDPAVTPGDYTGMLYMSTVTGFTPDISNLVRVLPVATLATVITGLVTGTPYYFRFRQTNTDGEIGALIAQATGTPT